MRRRVAWSSRKVTLLLRGGSPDPPRRVPRPVLPGRVLFSLCATASLPAELSGVALRVKREALAKEVPSKPSLGKNILDLKQRR